jgi:uncharacterized repeat protein (TIGR01451 family)
VPGAVVEYAITVANGGLNPASGVTISDPLPANTTFVTGAYGGSNGVQITGGNTPACVVETPTDTNADGCFNNGTSLIVNATALGSIPAGGSAVVRFRVSIN